MARSFALMFNALALIVLLAGLQTCAASTALVNRAPQDSPSHTCQGQTQCCKTIEMVDDGLIAKLLNSIGNAVDGILAGLSKGNIIGIQCIPLNLGIIDTQSACKDYPVCCSNIHLNGAVAVGCVPINVNVIG